MKTTALKELLLTVSDMARDAHVFRDARAIQVQLTSRELGKLLVAAEQELYQMDKLSVAKAQELHYMEKGK